MNKTHEETFNLNEFSLLFEEKFFIPDEILENELNPKFAGAAVLTFVEKLLNGLDIIKGYLENIY